jgi:hypothetical protein
VRLGIVIVCVASAVAGAGTAMAQSPAAPPTAATGFDSTAAEPGLADRQARYERPTWQKVAMVPAQILRFPFQVLNYPVENWLIHRDPGVVTVYGRRFRNQLGRQGIAVRVGGLGSGSGYGGGIAYDLPRALTFDKPVTLSAGSTFSGYDEYALSVDSLVSGPFLLGFRGSYGERPREDFYGLGPHSSLDARSTYQQDEWRAQFAAIRPLSARWRAGVLLGVSRSDIGRGRDPDFPTVLETFPPTIDGLQGRFDFIDYGVSLAYDSRDVLTYARRGQVVAANALFADGLRQTPHAYTKYVLEVQQFVPLPWPRRSLAARLRAAVTDNRGQGVDVPVFRLERMGGSRTIRGYDSFRFVDKDALLGNFEYRFPIWNIEPRGGQALDGAALFDFGTAIGDFAKTQQHDLHSSAGFGLRLVTHLGMIGRMDNMWTPEGFRIHLSFRGTF